MSRDFRDDAAQSSGSRAEQQTLRKTARESAAFLHINGTDFDHPALHVCRQLRAATVSGCARAARKHCSVT